MRGDKVVLGLSVWAFPCTEPFTVTYNQPGPAETEKLRSVWLVEAAGFEEQPVTIGGGCRLQWMVGARTGSVVLRGKRPFAKDVEPQKEWFTVSATGGPVTVTSAAWSPDDPHELKLGVSRDFTADETVTVSYRRPEGAAGLWDVDGNQLADITDRPVANGAPAATAVTLASDAGDDATYAAGEPGPRLHRRIALGERPGAARRAAHGRRPGDARRAGAAVLGARLGVRGGTGRGR